MREKTGYRGKYTGHAPLTATLAAAASWFLQYEGQKGSAIMAPIVGRSTGIHFTSKP
jgi:hypothetical protein